MPMFDHITAIDPAQPESYEGKRFLSFDIDWAYDEVLTDCIDLVERAEVKATWFVTHDTPLLKRLRANKNFALGIHPNFNELLVGNAKAGADADTILASLMALVPEARAVRSHSLVQSERLVDAFHRHGLTHISNFFIPEAVGPLRPWQLWDGMVAVPHGWQDNVSMRLGGTIKAPQAAGEGVSVLDFHPIHVFLNSENLARYEAARPHFTNPTALLAHRGKAHGARDILLSLLGGT